MTLDHDPLDDAFLDDPYDVYGLHYCVGAALARLEARIALEELLARAPDHRIDDDGRVRLRSSTFRGWEHVPVTTT